MDITLGADPEVFLKAPDGGLVSAIGLIGGSKEQPRPLPIGDGFAVQEDNVALEYNIPPSTSKLAFRTHINKAMSFLSDEIIGKGLSFSSLSAASFPKEQLKHPMAQVFGCDPDFDAWKEGDINPKPFAADRTLRSCGGHVHVGGVPFKSSTDVQRFIRYMDMCLSVPATLMDNGDLRKRLYGKKGAFRYKPYGCEYRSLSNFWVFDNKLIDWVWDATSMAVDAWQNNTFNVDEDADLVYEAVDHNNKQAAQLLVNKHSLLVV